MAYKWLQGLIEVHKGAVVVGEGHKECNRG